MKNTFNYFTTLVLFKITFLVLYSSIDSEILIKNYHKEISYNSKVPQGLYIYKYEKGEMLDKIRYYIYLHATCYNSNNIKKEQRVFNKYLKNIKCFTVEYNFKDTLTNCVRIHSKIFDSDSLLIFERLGYLYNDFQFNSGLLDCENDTASCVLYWLLNQTLVRDSIGNELIGFKKKFYKNGKTSCISIGNITQKFDPRGQLYYEYIGKLPNNRTDTTNYYDSNILYKQIIRTDSSKTVIEYYNRSN